MDSRSLRLAAVLLLSASVLFFASSRFARATASAAPATAPKTSFQVSLSWMPRVDVQCDTAMVYGINESLRERIQSWGANGYRVELMTGVAWGGYQDYVEGRFDGQRHDDTCQVERTGNPIRHAGKNGSFYFVPIQSYRNYLLGLLKKAIDEGIDTIYLEEPEYWARGGYAESFKREWKNLYGTDWVAPHSSVDARMMTSELEQKLYRDTLTQLFAACKEYGKTKGREIRCFVPTHSLINYSQWKIVTPMASLMPYPQVDGYIAQVWTGTARTPNNYNGLLRERTFETAYLEFAQMISMVRPTGRTCYLLADPIEDNQNLGWDDYEKNYRCVVTASLLHPDEDHYEVMPWPQRIFITPHFRTNAEAARRNDATPPERVPIPPDFATSLMASVNALNEMERGQKDVQWDCGTRRLGVLVADTMMFQREAPTPSDPALGFFFGLAMPLFKRGMPVKMVQLETLTSGTHALDDIDVLLMTYEGMKPLSPAYHDVLANWVRQGGGLIYVDDGQDPYNKIKQWWNQAGNHYDNPGQHLLKKMGLKSANTSGPQPCGKGFVYAIAQSPSALTYRNDGGATVRDWVRQMLTTLGKQDAWREQNHLVLRRGRFVVAANLSESGGDKPVAVGGRLVSLYDGKLPVVNGPTLEPGGLGLYIDLAKCTAPCVVASASRIRDVKVEGSRMRFVSRGPEGVTCRTRLLLPSRPREVKVTLNGQTQSVQSDWDEVSHTALLTHPNQAAPLSVECSW